MYKLIHLTVLFNIINTLEGEKEKKKKNDKIKNSFKMYKKINAMYKLLLQLITQTHFSIPIKTTTSFTFMYFSRCNNQYMIFISFA